MADVNIILGASSSDTPKSISHEINEQSKSNASGNVANTANYGKNLLSFGSGHLKFSGGFLCNPDNSIGSLVNEGGYNGYVFGATDDERKYALTMRIVSNDEDGKIPNVVIFGDRKAKQWIKSMIVTVGDFTTEVSSSSYCISVSIPEEHRANSVTINVTEWNRALYNACITSIDCIGSSVIFDKKFVQKYSVEQGLPDISSNISFGSENKVSTIDMKDNGGYLKSIYLSGIVIPNSSDAEVYLNGKSVFDGVSYESSYDFGENSYNMNVENIGNQIKITNVGNLVIDKEAPNGTLLDALKFIMKSVGYSESDITEATSVKVYNGISMSTISEYLSNFKIPHFYVNNATFGEQMQKICDIAQLSYYFDDYAKVKFVSMRPEITAVDVANAIEIPASSQKSKISCDIIPKNKVNKVSVNVNTVSSNTVKLSVNDDFNEFDIVYDGGYPQPLNSYGKKSYFTNVGQKTVIDDEEESYVTVNSFTINLPDGTTWADVKDTYFSAKVKYTVDEEKDITKYCFDAIKDGVRKVIPYLLDEPQTTHTKEENTVIDVATIDLKFFDDDTKFNDYFNNLQGSQYRNNDVSYALLGILKSSANTGTCRFIIPAYNLVYDTYDYIVNAEDYIKYLWVYAGYKLYWNKSVRRTTTFKEAKINILLDGVEVKTETLSSSTLYGGNELSFNNNEFIQNDATFVQGVNENYYGYELLDVFTSHSGISNKVTFTLAKGYGNNINAPTDIKIVFTAGKRGYVNRYETIIESGSYKVSVNYSDCGIPQGTAFPSVNIIDCSFIVGDKPHKSYNNGTVKYLLDKSLVYSSTNEELFTNMSTRLLDDYQNGIKTANIDIACTDYYTTRGRLVKSFKDGQFIGIGDIVVPTNNKGLPEITDTSGNTIYWKVIGATYSYDGVPKTSLRLMETKPLTM